MGATLVKLHQPTAERADALPEAMALSIPVVTVEKFSVLTGLSIGCISSACDRGFWPVVHIGRRRLINLEALRLQCLAKAQEFA